MSGQSTLIRLAAPLIAALHVVAQQPVTSRPAAAQPARTDLNLLGRANEQAGESRRNENVQFNLIDNNALKDLNIRLGTTATLIQEFRADRSYFSSEFGNRPPAAIHLPPAKPAPLHGSAFLSHVNSVFNARSFFTVGRLRPAHENHYGFGLARELWRGAFFSADASQQYIRGNVNGNVLVPRADKRAPLLADPAGRRLIRRFLDAFPAELPNRTDINERALNPNSPQAIDDHIGSARLDQRVSAKDSLALRYSFLAQRVDAFQLVAGQNPDTTTRNHAAQATWNRSISGDTLLQGTMLFDRVTSLLVPEPNAVGPQVNFSNVFTTLGPASNIPMDRIQNRFRYSGAVRQRRGAYGMHYGEILPATYHQLRFNPPHVVKFEFLAPDLLAPFSRLNVPVDPSARAAVYQLSPDLEVPYSHQYNLAWEPLTGASWRLQLGYVGSRSHDLIMAWYTNRARIVPGIPQTTATVNERRPDQSFYDVRRIINGSHAYFDAARITMMLPRVKGLSVDASYWFSKAIDLGSPYTGTGSSDETRVTLSQTEDNVWADMKGPSSFDQKHAFLVRAAWATPALPAARRSLRSWIGQWEFSGVVLLKTGTPFTVITGSDGPGYGNVDGDNGDRPHLLDPSILGRSVNHPDTSRAALPLSAFAFPAPADARGSLGSNTFHKDGVANVNAALSRTVTLRGDTRLLLRAESVNFLNTPQFAEPSRELASPSFGFITNTLNDGRSFRFLLRFSF